MLLVDAELPPLLASRIWVGLRQADAPVYERELRRLVAMLKGEKVGPPPRTGELQPDAGSAFRREGRLTRNLRIAADAVVLSGEAEEKEVRHRPQGLAGSAAPLLHEWRLAAAHRDAPDA